MARKVIYVRFHKELFFPGTSEIGVVLPSPKKTLDNLEMLATEIGLIIKFSFKGIKKEALIPYGNIVNMELERLPERKAEPKEYIE